MCLARYNHDDSVDDASRYYTVILRDTVVGVGDIDLFLVFLQQVA